MKPLIVPYFTRYTEFTLEDRLILANIAQVRRAQVDSFLIAKAHHKKLCYANADADEIDAVRQRFENILCVIAAFDQAIFDIYMAYGRVN